MPRKGSCWRIAIISASIRFYVTLINCAITVINYIILLFSSFYINLQNSQLSNQWESIHRKRKFFQILNVVNTVLLFSIDSTEYIKKTRLQYFNSKFQCSYFIWIIIIRLIFEEYFLKISKTLKKSSFIKSQKFFKN